MGLFASMFGTAEIGTTLVNNISSGIDKMFHTDQEKSEAAAAARTEGMAVYMKWLESTMGSRLARRYLAVLVTGIWGMEHVTGVILRVCSMFTNEVGTITSAKFVEASKYLTETATENNALVGVVLLFYFGGPAAIDGVKGMVAKWTSKDKVAK